MSVHRAREQFHRAVRDRRQASLDELREYHEQQALKAAGQLIRLAPGRKL